MNKEFLDDLNDMFLDLLMYIYVSDIPDEDVLYIEGKINAIRNKLFDLSEVAQ